MTGSEVRYVNSGGVHIAYRVFGDGPLDLVLVPAFTSHLEQNHEEDVLAVLDAAGAERPAVYGDLEGAALGADARAAGHVPRAGAGGLVSEPMARLLVGVVAPSLAHDQRFLQFMAKAMRSSVSPGAAQAWLRMIREIDVREALPQIRVPTLLVHQTGDRAVDVGSSRYAAGRIPGARLVELPDGDNLSFLGDTEAVAAEIEEFLTGSRTPPMAGAARAPRRPGPSAAGAVPGPGGEDDRTGRGSRDPVRGPRCPVPPGGARPVAPVRRVHLTRTL